jgi:hypothetical protein
MLGNPLASLSLDGTLFYDLLQFAWLHAAPLDHVRALVVGEATSPGVVAASVLEWAETLPPNYLADLTAELGSEFSRTSAAMAVCAESSKSKNGFGPCSPSA